MSPAQSQDGPVLHFIDTTGPGGAETVFLGLAEGFRRRGVPGHSLVVGDGWVLENVRRLGLPVDVVPLRGPVDPVFMVKLGRLVRRHGVRLIHAHLLNAAVHASLVARWTGTPVVATYHGASDTEAGRWTRTLQHRLVDRQAATVCVSEALRDSMRTIPGVDADAVTVIHNGVDTDRFASADGAAVRREHGVPDDAFLVGALGNFRPAKDYPTLIRAAAELAEDRRVVFAIAGQRSEPLHGELVALRDSLGLRDRVSFWGFRNDAPAVLAAYDTLAISSSSEGFSLAAIQALAAGTPVVATRSGGPEGILTHERDGLLVPVGDPGALAAAIARVRDDAGLRDRVTEAGRQTVEDRFSMTAMLDAYQALYDRVTGARPA